MVSLSRSLWALSMGLTRIQEGWAGALSKCLVFLFFGCSTSRISSPSFFFSDFPSSVDQLIPLSGRISDMQALLSFTSLSLLVLPTVAMTGMVGTCYFANGTALPVDPIYNQYQPCQSGGPSTICCGIFRDNVAGGNITAGDTTDECLPNGLCQNRATTTDGVEETK